MGRLDRPNDAGRWTRLAQSEIAALWKREHTAFPPPTQFYVLAPPRQHQIFYREAEARRAFDDLAVRTSRESGCAPPPCGPQAGSVGACYPGAD